jgi:hypothetical protein
MQTECSSEQFELEGFGRRRVVAAFDAGAMSRMPAGCCCGTPIARSG